MGCQDSACTSSSESLPWNQPASFLVLPFPLLFLCTRVPLTFLLLSCPWACRTGLVPLVGPEPSHKSLRAQENPCKKEGSKPFFEERREPRAAATRCTVLTHAKHIAAHMLTVTCPPAALGEGLAVPLQTAYYYSDNFR